MVLFCDYCYLGVKGMARLEPITRRVSIGGNERKLRRFMGRVWFSKLNESKRGLHLARLIIGYKWQFYWYS